jgi:hypothetical protein
VCNTGVENCQTTKQNNRSSLEIDLRNKKARLYGVPFLFPLALGGMPYYRHIYDIHLWIRSVGVLAEKKIAEWFHKPNVLIQATAIPIMASLL